MFEKCSICEYELDCEFFHDSSDCYYSPVTATCIVCRDMFEINTYGDTHFCSKECKNKFEDMSRSPLCIKIRKHKKAV